MKRQSPPPLTAQLDHLVVAAATLADGVRWCEKVLGVTPGPGGEHPLMGTHNRLLSIASPAFPLAYLEVIAIHAGAPCARSGALKRWFDLDDRELHAQLVSHGPQLIHFVARTAQATASVRALSAMGLDRGRLLQASRETGAGLLQWKIAVRDDGQRLFYGALPTLIEWGDMHPAQSLPDAGLRLLSLNAAHPRPMALRAAHEAIGLQDVAIKQGAPELAAQLETPLGVVVLSSRGI